MTTSEFLGWLMNSGGIAIVVSWIAERLPFYQAWPPDAKKISYIIACVALGLALYAAQTYVTPATWAAIDPWFKVAAGLVLMTSAGTGYHKLAKPE